MKPWRCLAWWILVSNSPSMCQPIWETQWREKIVLVTLHVHSQLHTLLVIKTSSALILALKTFWSSICSTLEVSLVCLKLKKEVTSRSASLKMLSHWWKASMMESSRAYGSQPSKETTSGMVKRPRKVGFHWKTLRQTKWNELFLWRNYNYQQIIGET